MKKKIIKFKDKVQIKWLDAFMSAKNNFNPQEVLNFEETNSNWDKIQDIQKKCENPLFITSIGYLIGQGKYYVAIAHTIDQDTTIRPLFIPIQSIYAIKRIK